MAALSLSKNQSHSSSYSRISFKKEENGSEKRIDKTLLPLPGGQLFQIHGSKLKLHPVGNLSQASVLCITHSVFFFGVCKDAFNRLFTPPVKALVLRCIACVICQILVILPDMPLYGFHAVFGVGAKLSGGTISMTPRSIFPRSSIFHHPEPFYHINAKKPSRCWTFSTD